MPQLKIYSSLNCKHLRMFQISKERKKELNWRIKFIDKKIFFPKKNEQITNQKLSNEQNFQFKTLCCTFKAVYYLKLFFILF